VIDEYGLWDEVRLQISVIGKQEKEKVEKVKTSSTKKTTKTVKIKPVEERKELIFPELLLQTKNTNVSESGSTIHCITTTETCKLNFTMT